MKRKLLIAALVCCSVWPSFAQKAKTKPQAVKAKAENINYKEAGAPMPPLRIYTRQGKYITAGDIKNDAPLMVVLFNPTCDHCEDQARLLKENIGLFKKSHLLFMAAPGMLPYIPYFVNNTRTEDVEKIEIGVDSADFIKNTFLYESLPQINIYDSERKLQKIFTGFTPLDSLKSFIE